MLGTKLAFSTAYHPQTDCLAERMIQTMEDIIRRFGAYGMKYRDHKGYTHYWVTLLPELQLAYNTSQHSTTAKDFHDMWKRACDTASRCIAEEKEYNKQRWDKYDMEPDFKEGDQVLVSTLNFNNLKGSKRMRIICSALYYHYTDREKCSGDFQTEEDEFPSRKKNPTPQEIVEVEDSPGPVKTITKARKIRLNSKDQRQYFIRFKKQTGDKDKLLAENSIPDGNFTLRRLRASRKTEQSHQ
ncbi:hypothetical protein O181_123707 [Austropuccinia psidii MF-1]|uniref:Integrase catalytic domain-containing protein n=1 Tax=Austropuccinia psidii MF-1 TaxID=1389203 RepID=A0A9Q3KN78_9BASI|nr:hypothetical protein [Austropuccinia psidii MF-1]